MGESSQVVIAESLCLSHDYPTNQVGRLCQSICVVLRLRVPSYRRGRAV